jgi:hypothetical protein
MSNRRSNTTRRSCATAPPRVTGHQELADIGRGMRAATHRRGVAGWDLTICGAEGMFSRTEDEQTGSGHASLSRGRPNSIAARCRQVGHAASTTCHVRKSSSRKA